MATHWTLGCDAADPHRIAGFWRHALGYVNEPGYDNPDGASIIDPDGNGPAIGFLRVPEGKTAKNRMHFDLRAPGAEAAEVARLEALGASVVRHHPSHTVMRDPEGNEFCVEPGPAPGPG